MKELMEVVCFVLLQSDLLNVCAMCWGNLQMFFFARERSPPHLFLYLFIDKQEKSTQGSAGLNTGELIRLLF